MLPGSCGPVGPASGTPRSCRGPRGSVFEGVMRWSPPFRSIQFLWCLVAGLAVSGCGRGGDHLPREPITGTVSLDGTPLADGNITFMPVDAAKGTEVGAVIAQGAFSVPR